MTTALAQRTGWAEVADRFCSKVRPDASGCMIWTAATDSKGYGAFRIGSRMVGAHRVSFETFRFAIPDSLHVLHHCDTPACVNPRHLFLGTQADNMADKVAKRRTRHGSKHQNSKLTEYSVRAIRILLRDGVPQHEIAKQFSVSQGTITNISRGLIWRHV